MSNDPMDGLMDNLMGEIQKQYEVVNHPPENAEVLMKTGITPGYAQKIHALYRELKKQGGQLEMYVFPLRRPGEDFVRDFFVPTHKKAEGAYVEVDATAVHEFNSSELSHMLVDGWDHFHPDFATLHPSGTDMGNNERVIRHYFHNMLPSLREVIMRGVISEVKGDKVQIYHPQTGKIIALPLSDEMRELEAFAKKFGLDGKISDEQIESFLKDWISRDDDITALYELSNNKTAYAHMRIWNGRNLDKVLKLNGTPQGGIDITCLFSGLITQEYMEGKLVGTPQFRQVPTGIVTVADDITYDPAELERIVKYKIIEPTRFKIVIPPIRPAQPATAAVTAAQPAATAAPGTVPATTPAEPAVAPAAPIVVDQRYSLFRMLLNSLLKRFGYTPMQASQALAQESTPAAVEPSELEKKTEEAPHEQ